MEQAKFLLKEAKKDIYKFDYELAHEKLSKAHLLDPTNTDILDIHSEVLMDVGMIEEAQKLIYKSIEIAPDKGYSKYLNLSHILNGYDSLKSIQKAIEILETDYKSKQGRQDGKLKNIKKNLVSAYCYITDLYMTDLCDEKDAEIQCEVALKKALSYDPKNFEALQSFASFRISQSMFDESLELLKRSYELWKDLDHDDENRPPFEFKVNTAKLFIELEQYKDASEILEELTEDDELIAEIWYLLAFCYSHFDVSSAPECLEKAIKLLHESDVKEEVIWKQVNELSEKLKNELGNIEENGHGDNQMDVD